MAKLGDLVVRIGANTKDFNKGLRSIKSQIRKDTQAIQDMGKTLSIGITAPLAIMGATSVNAFREQAKAVAQVEAGLKSTQNQVGFTSKELQQMATDLQNKTLFGDEVILKDATAQLLTFTNISGQNFARTQQAALDLATRLDGDLKGASIQLGKALNDPVANLSALSRSGIQFSEDQKEVIKSLAETGQLAEAQTIILDELNKQYGGSAAAAAEADGGFTQLANSFGDLQEEIGRLLVQYLRPIVDRLREFVTFLQGTSDSTKTFALAIAGIAAAIGPVLIIIPQLIQGLSLARTAMLTLNTAMLANPFLAVAAAITVVVGAIILLTDETKKAVSAVDSLVEANKGLSLEEQKRNIEEQITKQQEIVEGLKQERDAKQALVDQGYGGKAIKEANESAAAYAAATSQLDEMNAMLANVNEELNKNAESSNSAAGATNTLTLEMVKASAEAYKLQQELAKLGTQADELVDKDLNLNEAFFGKKEPQLDLQGFDFVDEVFGDEEELAAAGDRIRETAAATQGIMQQVAANINGFFTQTFQGVIAGTTTFKDALLEALKAIAIKLGAMLASFAVLSAFIPGFGAAAGGLKGFISSGFGFDIPGFANGGIVSGPTMAMVGEYPGARTNPEVIAPLDKLRSMIGGNTVQVTGKISGRDILLTSERNAIDRNRVRGF